MTREEAVKEIRKRHCTENKFCHDDYMCSENACPYDMAIAALQEPEIVHCKDCKLHNSCSTEDVFNFVRLENGFCAVGKAKKN